jgi:hypothetical protein
VIPASRVRRKPGGVFAAYSGSEFSLSCSCYLLCKLRKSGSRRLEAQLTPATKLHHDIDLRPSVPPLVLPMPCIALDILSVVSISNSAWAMLSGCIIWWEFGGSLLPYCHHGRSDGG